MQATYKLVDFITGLKFEDLGSDVVEAVKKEVLDTLATAIGGGNCEGVKELYAIVKDWGGKKESGVINFGGKYPTSHAAMLNTVMSHALDYDDTHETAGLHPGVVAIPTAFAVGQALGQVKGKDLITAIAAGVDIHCRFGRATKLARPNVLEGGWHFTPLYGYISSAALAGKLMKLDREKMINALGIAYHQAAGNIQCIVDGALTKRMGPGFAVRGGITAALMAEKGITGAKNIVDGEMGIYKLYHAGYDEEKLLGGLGKEFGSTGVSFKPYPCCRVIHPYLDGMLKLVADNNIKAEEVIEIVPITFTAAQLLSEPLEVKAEPRSIVDSQFSVPWALACVVVRGKAGINEFTEVALKNRSIIDMANKVKAQHDTNMIAQSLEQPVTIKMKTKRGEFQVTTSGHVLGSPANPLSFDVTAQKFMDCATNAIKPLTESDKKKLVDLVKNLEKVDDAGKIIRLLS